MLTLTPSSERQTSGWRQHRFPGFGLQCVSGAPQDDSNHRKHAITQDYFSGLALQAVDNGAKMIDWLLCLLESCRLRAATSVSLCLPAAAQVQMCWLPALCWGLKEASVTPGTGTSEPSQENRPTKKGKSSSSGLVFLLLHSCSPTPRVGCLAAEITGLLKYSNYREEGTRRDVDLSINAPNAHQRNLLGQQQIWICVVSHIISGQKQFCWSYNMTYSWK